MVEVSKSSNEIAEQIFSCAPPYEVEDILWIMHVNYFDSISGIMKVGEFTEI